jgi:hypothetical protein
MFCSIVAADEHALPKGLRVDEKALVLVLLLVLEPGLLGGQVGKQGIDEKGGCSARVREVGIPGGKFETASARPSGGGRDCFRWAGEEGVREEPSLGTLMGGHGVRQGHHIVGGEARPIGRGNCQVSKYGVVGENGSHYAGERRATIGGRGGSGHDDLLDKAKQTARTPCNSLLK